ncbi:MAG TPA: phage holin family protein [Candidatus Baltobacteraceae bacterium]|nr:phage holin family protein [Candidatus Baltobacteraceae bacterium]
MAFQETAPRPYELRAQSSRTLLQRLYREMSALIAEEAELAKVEIRDRAALAFEGIFGLAISVALALVATASLAACAIAGLAYVMPLWAAALIVGAVGFALALVIAASARRPLARAAEPMSSTLATMLRPASVSVTPADRRVRIESERRRVEETIAALEQKKDLVSPLRDTALGLGSLGIALGSIVRSEGNGP